MLTDRSEISSHSLRDSEGKLAVAIPALNYHLYLQWCGWLNNLSVKLRYIAKHSHDLFFFRFILLLYCYVIGLMTCHLTSYHVTSRHVTWHQTQPIMSHHIISLLSHGGHVKCPTETATLIGAFLHFSCKMRNCCLWLDQKRKALWPKAWAPGTTMHYKIYFKHLLVTILYVSHFCFPLSPKESLCYKPKYPANLSKIFQLFLHS